MPERENNTPEAAHTAKPIPPEVCIGLLSPIIFTNPTNRPSRRRKPLLPTPRSNWQQAPRTEQLTHLYGVQAHKKKPQ